MTPKIVFAGIVASVFMVSVLPYIVAGTSGVAPNGSETLLIVAGV